MSRTTRHFAAAALSAVAALCAPAVASADSIVYIDGGNVWSASPDGAHKVQLTDGGDWHSPTQADDGTIAAVKGALGPIRIMARDGRPLREITTETARTGNGGTFAPRPVDLSFSPDGSKIAYAYVAMSCPPGSTCTDQQATFYTRADVAQATPQSEWGNQGGASDPEWITNDRALVQSASHVDIDPLGGGDYSYTKWVVGGKDFGDPELSRDGKRLATTFDYGANKIIAFYVVNGDPRTELPPALPTAVCNTEGGDEKAADPSWSPDSSSVAFQDRDGINVVRFSAFNTDGCAVASHHVLSATGATPDWGPADPPAARYVAPSDGQTPGGTVTPGAKVPDAKAPAGKTPSGTSTGERAALKVSIGRVSRAALRKGLTVKVTAPKAGASVSVRLTTGGRQLARRTVKARKAGAVSVKLPALTARRAAALKGKTVTLKVSADGRTATRTFKVA